MTGGFWLCRCQPWPEGGLWLSQPGTKINPRDIAELMGATLRTMLVANRSAFSDGGLKNIVNDAEQQFHAHTVDTH